MLAIPGKVTVITREHVTKTLVKRYFDYYKEDEGRFCLDDDFAKLLSFQSSKAFEISLRGHFKSERTSKLETDVLVTAVTVYYFRLVAVDHKSEWASAHTKTRKWLTAKCGSAEVEQEVMEYAKKYVVEKYHVDRKTIELDNKFEGMPSPVNLV